MRLSVPGWRGIFAAGRCAIFLCTGHALKLQPYAPAMVWGAFLLFLGGRSEIPTVQADLPLDKAAHFLLYGLLGWLAARGWTALRQPARFWPLFFAVVVGAMDELHQRTVPTRSAEWLDFISDAAGITIAYTVRSHRAAARVRNSG